MAYAAIVIGNLTTPALYVTSFHAEIYSDSGYTTLVGSTSSAAVKLSSGEWGQSDLMSFPGLVRGNTYYVQVGPVSPGGAANFTRYSLMAGSITIPACTFAGTFSSTVSGITYDITPANIPTDIDHFEAIWTKDGSAPSNSSLINSWEGNPLPNGLVHIFAGGTAGQTIKLFMRAVSTSGGYQNWYAVDSRVVSTYSGTTSAAGIMYADGTTVEALKPGQVGADVTATNTAADTSAVNGINAGHIADSATSLGFVGKWWRTSSGAPAPSGGGELPYAPMFTTQDANINYNILGYSSWTGSIQTPPLSPYPPTHDGQWIYARFTGYYTCSTTGTYTFGTNSDDGSNMYVNGQKLFDHLATASSGSLPNLTYLYSGTIALTAGDVYEVIVEYRNGVNNAGIQVLMTPPGGSVQLLDLGTAFKSAAFTHYTDGTLVDALKPAAAGADVTSVNVSADTTLVNGVASNLVSPISTLMPAQPGADVTAAQPIVYTGLSSNLIPNGTFILGNIEGWERPNSGTALPVYGSGGMLMNSSSSAASPAFNVTPGQKYRLIFTGMVNGSGTQSVFFRISYGSSYAPTIPETTYIDFLQAGSIGSSLSSYAYDWTCPAGVYYASLITYELGTAQLLYTNISAQDYGASGEWGADKTSNNTAANTITVGTVPAGDIVNTVNPGGGVDFNNTGNTNQGALSKVNQANTNNIVANAVNSSISSTSTGIIVSSTSGDTQLIQNSLPTNGGYTKVRCIVGMSGYSTSGHYPQPDLNIRRGGSTGTVIGTLSTILVPPDATNGTAYVMLEAVDTSPVGTQQYTVTVFNRGYGVYVPTITLIIENAKV